VITLMHEHPYAYREKMLLIIVDVCLCQVRDIVYVHSNLRLVDKLEEISYSGETTVPWFEQREFISDSDSDEDN